MPPLYLLQNAGASLWAPKGAVGVVTGANKGIGLEIAAGLAANGLPVIATARSEERGRAAVEAIKSRAETEAEVSFLQLDVASDASVSEFARKLRGAAPAGVAVLVNNAAIAFKGQTWGGDEAEETVNTNYRGTRRVTEAVLPLLVEGGRVVNVCSRSGQLQRLFGGGGGNGGGGSGSGGGSPRSPRPPPISDEKEVLKKKWDQAAETYVLDTDMAATLKASNPEAFRNVVRRMLEASGRGLWDAGPEVLERLQREYGDIEDKLEGVA